MGGQRGPRGSGAPAAPSGRIYSRQQILQQASLRRRGAINDDDFVGWRSSFVVLRKKEGSRGDWDLIRSMIVASLTLAASTPSSTEKGPGQGRPGLILNVSTYNSDSSSIHRTLRTSRCVLPSFQHSLPQDMFQRILWNGDHFYRPSPRTAIPYSTGFA